MRLVEAAVEANGGEELDIGAKTAALPEVERTASSPSPPTVSHFPGTTLGLLQYDLTITPELVRRIPAESALGGRDPRATGGRKPVVVGKRHRNGLRKGRSHTAGQQQQPLQRA